MKQVTSLTAQCRLLQPGKPSYHSVASSCWQFGWATNWRKRRGSGDKVCLKGKKTLNKENKAENVTIASQNQLGPPAFPHFHPHILSLFYFHLLFFSSLFLAYWSFFFCFFPPLTVSVFFCKFWMDKRRTCAARKIQVINTGLSIRRDAQTPVWTFGVGSVFPHILVSLHVFHE